MLKKFGKIFFPCLLNQLSLLFLHHMEKNFQREEPAKWSGNWRERPRTSSGHVLWQGGSGGGGKEGKCCMGFRLRPVSVSKTFSIIVVATGREAGAANESTLPLRPLLQMPNPTPLQSYQLSLPSTLSVTQHAEPMGNQFPLDPSKGKSCTLKKHFKFVFSANYRTITYH
jgi:hypothetical protein